MGTQLLKQRHLLLILFMLLLTAGFTTRGYSQCSVATDKGDYYPGETVIITGSGWEAGETVELLIEHTFSYHPDETFYTIADSLGEIYYDEYVIAPDELNELFFLTAFGETSNCMSTCTFTDGNKIGSVTVSAQTPNPLNTSIGNTATYNITLTRSGNGQIVATFSVSGLPAGSTATFNPTSVNVANNASIPNYVLSITVPSNTISGTYIFTVTTNEGTTGNPVNTSGNGSLVVSSSCYPDNTAPIWTTSATALNIAIECNNAAGLIAAQAMAPLATDNCGSVTYYKTPGNFVAGSCGATGTYTNTWVAKDASLNTSSVFTQLITITDVTPPTWTTTAGALNTSVECSDAAGLTAAQAMAPLATDNCGAVTYEKTTGLFVAGSCGATGTYTNTWVAKDACLNTSSVFTQLITITDATAPTWTTTAGALNASVECSDAGGLTAAQAMAPLATDNCGSVTYYKTPGNFVAGSCGATGTYTNTWVAKDACLNTSSVFT
ncbi:MAG TPA: hypothetical protein VK172_11155, partial [Lentimicrobium sp.]|nr:hypothetical protein [Lentimicrobium sp.]